MVFNYNGKLAINYHNYLVTITTSLLHNTLNNIYRAFSSCIELPHWCIVHKWLRIYVVYKFKNPQVCI